MLNSIADQLSSLAHLDKRALSELWLTFFQTNPPRGMRKDLLRQFVAYRLQEQGFGRLSNDSHRRLRELANSIEPNGKNGVPHRSAIKPGTRFIRQWKEQVHVVNVEEQAYEYKGIRYQSLSEIARLITGTRWSGPLFFGLKHKRSERREAR